MSGYEFYDDCDDPSLIECEAYMEGDPYNAVQCENCGDFWNGPMLTDGCPECGSECHDIEQD